MSCKRRQSRLHLAFLALVVLALFMALPGLAAASSGDAAAVQGPPAPTLSVPGVFSVSLGQGFTSTPEGVTLDSAQIAIPAVGAVATVEGLRLGQNFQPQDWDAITVTQPAPRETDTYSISNATLAVGGPSSGYSTTAYADFDLHGSENVKINGTFGVRFDGLARTVGVGMRDADLALQAGPLNVTLTGANSQVGGMAIDQISVSGDRTGASLEVSGFQSTPAGVDWDSLDVSGGPLTIGNALVVSPVNLHVGGSSDAYARTAVVGLDVTAGNVAQVQGTLVTNMDPATGARQFALQNASATVGTGNFSLGFDGMNTGPTGTSVDNVKLQAGQVGFTAEVNGLTVDPAGQAAFENATIQYQPQGAGTASGFVMEINQTDAGYVMTTTTLLPSRK
ncbi:MAG: hypothetical protein ACM30E_08360 [Nitrososphaerales archaeon]